MKPHYLLFASFFALFFACQKKYDLPSIAKNTDWKSKTISPYPQDLTGNPDSGFYFLTNGAYLGSGIPYDLMKKRVERNREKFAHKSGLASEYGFAIFETIQGVEVMNGTCFSCHAGKVNGSVILGLGNSLNDNQTNLTFPAKLMNWRVRKKYKNDSMTIAAFEDFGNYFKLMAPYIHTENPGVNPAARIAEACMRYRNPVDLSYTSESQYDVREYNLASDIPALWHMQKKNALYYTAVGRGDFTKLLFQASVLGIKDSTAARVAQKKFVHIAAWINSIEPPKYPAKIDFKKAALGKQIFQKKCQGCHGTYDKPETYPNKVISITKIGTDPLYASYGSDSRIVDWYNKSWFAQSNPRSWFEPERGYIAPPLDGIWATAPYLHNGSVPTIYQVLKSNSRPKKWKRSKDSKKYDWEKLGWKYKDKNRGKGVMTYDTTLPGYGNQGHTFADSLSENYRWALVEYLKTL